MKLSKRGEYALRALIDFGIAQELGRPMLKVGERMATSLDALIEHWRGAPERARKGLAGSPAQLAEIERRLAPRIAAALALRALVAPTAP